MDDLPPLTHLPLIPAQILRQHHVYEPVTLASAPALASSGPLAGDRELPIGLHTSPNGRRRKSDPGSAPPLGKPAPTSSPRCSLISLHREVIYCEVGVPSSTSAAAHDLLSRCPDFQLARPLSSIWVSPRVCFICVSRPRRSASDVRSVRALPWRGVASLTGDGTAFDTLITYDTAQGRTGFVAVESSTRKRAMIPPLQSDLAMMRSQAHQSHTFHQSALILIY
jgi:hypothetical protein